MRCIFGHRVAGRKRRNHGFRPVVLDNPEPSRRPSRRTLPAFGTVQARDVPAGSVDGVIERLRIDAVDTGLMSDRTPVMVNPGRGLAIVSIPLEGTGTNTTSNRALCMLRD